MKLKFTFLIGIFTLIVSCSEDSQIVDSIPEFNTVQESISTLAGETFIFSALVSDPAGIKSVNFKYDLWFLDKTINKDSLPKTYEISYAFKVPSNAIENSTHIIPITVTNSGGKSTVKNITITLDKDVISPLITVNKPIDKSSVLIGSGNEIEIDLVISDKELAEFSVESSLLTESFSISGNSYNYKKIFDVSVPNTYNFKFTVKDVSGNISTKTVSVNVLDKLTFNDMYITDVTDESLLVSDLFGIPYKSVPSSVTSENGYVFTARYYSSAPNSQVRFIAQKTSFGPFSFGSDPNNSGTLVLGNSADVNPIILPQVGYYEIKMDLRNSSYTLTRYTPTDTPFGQIYIIGTGVYIDDTTSTCTSNANNAISCWNFASGKPFTKNATNNYLWTIDVTIKDEPTNDGANGFILNANPNGWSPFWRLDRLDDPEATVPNGGLDYVFPASALNKNYRFTFDTHLNRITAVLR